jgi:hypothetical protein
MLKKKAAAGLAGATPSGPSTRSSSKLDLVKSTKAGRLAKASASSSSSSSSSGAKSARGSAKAKWSASHAAAKQNAPAVVDPSMAALAVAALRTPCLRVLHALLLTPAHALSFANTQR